MKTIHMDWDEEHSMCKIDNPATKCSKTFGCIYVDEKCAHSDINASCTLKTWTDDD